MRDGGWNVVWRGRKRKSWRYVFTAFRRKTLL